MLTIEQSSSQQTARVKSNPHQLLLSFCHARICCADRGVFHYHSANKDFRQSSKKFITGFTCPNEKAADRL